MSSEITYMKSSNLLSDAQLIIESAQQHAYQVINVAMVQRNWLLGKRIAEEELRGEDRAKYGAEVITKLAKELTYLYGKGFDYSTLYKFVRFFKLFPDIFHTVSGKSDHNILDTVCQKSNPNILDTVWTKSQPLLTWSHYLLYYKLIMTKPDNGICRRQPKKHGATKYKTYLPTESELRAEIERQKQIFYLQHGGEKL